MRLLTLLGALAFCLSIPIAAFAQEDPFGSDPNRLVPFKDTVQDVYTSGTDVLEVWKCDVGDWDTQFSLSQTVDSLNSVLGPYFEWLSDDNYITEFVVGGTVQSDDVITQSQLESLEQPFAPDCEAEVRDASTSDPNAALIIVDIPFADGYGTAGAVCPEPPFNGCRLTYPANSRRTVVGAATVVTRPPFEEPHWLTIAHEIGHTLSWAHSYGGLTRSSETGPLSEYDNPMDLMSGAVHSGVPVGTIAYNRYAAGWIEPSDAVRHTAGTATYQLAPIGGSGVGLIAIPGDSEGHFYAIGGRRRTVYDSKLPKSGVEIYEIDQRPEFACKIPAAWPQNWPCFSTLVRIKQEPPVQGFVGTDHVLSLDESINVGGFTVEVLAAGTSAFTVRVSPRDPGTFLDDDNSIHEANIEAIATAGITNGCNLANDLFCPEREVTRAEMAAFLIRGLDLEDELIPFQGTFPDVPEDVWYTDYVETLASLGIAQGFPDGGYHPSDGVSRAEMAVFLVRAFGPVTIPGAEGIFTDVPVNEWYADQAEQIFNDGISLGCSTVPLRYCPLDPVPREQMASFMARALGIGT